ncbi:MAG: vitamin K epoxide reductase family protein [Candidatus Izemoplasmatales bacterium]
MESVEHTILTLCKKLDIKHRAKDIILEFRNHHNSRSLKALSDALSRNGIRNKAIKITQDRIKELPAYSLLYLKDKEEFFILDKCDKKIQITDPGEGKINYTYNELFEIWDGTVILISNDSSLNILPKNESIISQFVYSGIGIMLISFLVFSCFYFTSTKWFVIILFFLDLIGIYICSTLIKIEYYGILNGFGKFCHIGKSFDCISVANSKMSAFFKYFSLSELGFIYYSFLTFVNLSVIIFNYNYLTFVFLLSIVAIPVVLASFIQQIFVLKKYCLFCLLIDFIVIIHLTILPKVTNINLIEINIHTILILVYFLISSLTALFFYKKSLIKKVNNNSQKNDLKFFHRNRNVIDLFIEKEKIIDIEPDSLDIILGNKESTNKIVFLLNPFCKKCRDYFIEIQILLSIKIDSQFIIRLIQIDFNNNLEKDLIHWLYIMNQINGADYVLENLNKIYLKVYNRRKYIKYLLKTNQKLLSNNIPLDKLKANQNWCENNNINSIPNVIINGNLFPKHFPSESIYYYITN